MFSSRDVKLVSFAHRQLDPILLTKLFVAVAAGYALYGSATMIVLSIGNGPVNGFMLDPVRRTVHLALGATNLVFAFSW